MGYTPLATASPVATSTFTLNAANNVSMNMYSDAATEIALEAFATSSPTTKYTFNIAKYGGALKVGGNTTVTGVVSATGNIVSTGGRLQVVNTMESTTNTLVVANGSAGNIILRPNGSGSSSGEMTLDNTGKITPTSLQLGGVQFTVTRITVNSAAPGALPQGEIYFRY
jgi:hypothetical protein